MADLYSDSPIFTLLYDEQAIGTRFTGHLVTASSLEKLKLTQRNFRRLLPLYPWAIQRLSLPPSEVVLSSSSAFAHGVLVPAESVHICYCHTPFRYAWSEERRALREVPGPLRGLLRLQLARMRRWDVSASKRVDSYVANSQVTRERIRGFYGRDATVIHPPVETHRFKTGVPGDSLLVVSELVAHKRVHIALEAARLAGVPIVVVGSGPDHAALSAAYPEADFIGRASDEELVERYATARAVIVPGIEEFGITAVEAQAAGRPVIAAAAGGVLETVLDGQTGLLVRPDDAKSFAAAIDRLETINFTPARAVENAEHFSVRSFQARLSSHVKSVLR